MIIRPDYRVVGRIVGDGKHVMFMIEKFDHQARQGWQPVSMPNWPGAEVVEAPPGSSMEKLLERIELHHAWTEPSVKAAQ